MKNNKKIVSVIVYLVLALIVIFGLYLRLTNLDIKLFWFDEYLTEDRSFFSFSKIWAFYKTQRVLLFSLVMKLYSFVVLYINKAEYMTEFQLRLPNVIIGSVGIIAMFIVGNKLKDYCNGIIAATITAFSWYLIYHSREARFYPLYFLIASFLLLYGTLILIQKVEDDTLKNYFAYTIFASLGMYAHSGFWMLFAISNSFLALAITIKFFFSNLDFKEKIKGIIIRIGIIAIPLLVSLPLFIHLTQKDSDRAYSTGGKMLPDLTYKAINSFSLEFWGLCPFAKYALIIITIMGFLMLLVRQLRKQAAYYLAIKLLPFIVASFLPNNIIKENLKASYIIFILASDILIVSLFFSYVINVLSYLLCKLVKFIKSDLLAVCLSIVFCVAFSFNVIPKLYRSGLYKPYQRLGQPVEYLLEIFKPNQFVITDDYEVNFYLNHLQKLGRFPANHSAVIDVNYINEGCKIPNDINSLLILCFGGFKSYNATRHLKEINNCNFIFVETGNIFTPKTIMGLTSAIITKTNPIWAYALMDDLLEKWRKLYLNNSVHAILDNLSTFNLIDNGDFKDDFNNWKGAKDSFEIVNDNEQSYLSLKNCGDSWDSIRQYINVVSGAVYCVSAEVRRKENVEPGDYKSFVVFSYINDKDKDLDEQYLNINRNKTHNWTKIEMTINTHLSGNACIRIQYKGLGVNDIKNVRCDKISIN